MSASTCARRNRRSALYFSVFIAALLFALSLAAAPNPTHAQSPCQELIVNGGFEDGHEPWNQYSSSNYDLISGQYPRTGENSAWLVAVNNEEGWIAQTVKLPADPGSLRLQYWWSVVTQENPGGAFDFMKVQLMRVDGTLLATLATYNDQSAEGWVWNFADLDLAPYAGETVQVRFWAQNDNLDPTYFFVDDVSVQSCPSGGTATLTPSPTLSITPGPSPTPTSTPRARLYLPLVLR